MYFEGNDLHHQTFLFMLQLRQDLASYIHQYTDIISNVVYDIIPDIEYTDTSAGFPVHLCAQKCPRVLMKPRSTVAN